MKTNILNTAKLLLLLLAVLPLFADFIFQAKQNAIRHRMKEELEESLVQIITIDQEEIHWAEPGKEIWVNGRLFDIKSYSLKDKQYTFTGLFDEEETTLVYHCQKSQESQNGPANKMLTQLFQLFQSFYSTPQEEAHLPVTSIAVSFRETEQPLAAQFFSITTPPPKMG